MAAIAQKIGLPEERVAQIAQMIRQNGMADAQMGAMMGMALSKGVQPQEIFSMLTSLGVSASQVIRVMHAQGVMDDEEAERRLADERAAAERRAAAEAKQGRKNFCKKAAIIVFWLVVWEIADRIADNRLILAGPLRTLEALSEQVVQLDFWVICGASFGRITLGFLLSFVVGFLVALAACRVRLVRDFVDPIMSLLRTIPVVSFIIMLLIWVGNQALTVFLAFFIVLPIIYTNMVTGFESVDRQMLEMARVYGLSALAHVFVRVPAGVHAVSDEQRQAVAGMSWKSGIMAEVLATPKPSIGKEMSTARTFLDTPDLFAWTVVVMVLSAVFEKLFMEVLKLANRPLGGLIGKKGRGMSEMAGAAAGRAGAGAGADAGRGCRGRCGCGGRGRRRRRDGAGGRCGRAGLGQWRGRRGVRRRGVRHVCKSYGDNRVLRDVTFRLPGGGVTCLMAPSGSGKTTLFRVLLGLEDAESGSITGVRAGEVSMMFQEDRLCETLTRWNRGARTAAGHPPCRRAAAFGAHPPRRLHGSPGHAAFRRHAAARVAGAGRGVPQQDDRAGRALHRP